MTAVLVELVRQQKISDTLVLIHISASVLSPQWHHSAPLSLDDAAVSLTQWPMAGHSAPGGPDVLSPWRQWMLSAATILCRQSLNEDDITQGDRRKTTSPSVPVSGFSAGDDSAKCYLEADAKPKTLVSLHRNIWKLNLIHSKVDENGLSLHRWCSVYKGSSTLWKPVLVAINIYFCTASIKTQHLCQCLSDFWTWFIPKYVGFSVFPTMIFLICVNVELHTMKLP